jgi:hypothetical protein
MRDGAAGAKEGGLPCAKMVRAATSSDEGRRLGGIAGAFMSGKESKERRDGWRPICAIVGLDARVVVDPIKTRGLFQRDDKSIALML